MTEPKLGPYDVGHTTFYSFEGGPFSYCLYVPPHLDRRKPVHLVVVMHGSGRRPETYRDAFAPLGDFCNCVVLAPLFPVDVYGDGNANGYKYMVERETRYDLVLLGMIDKSASRLALQFAGICMFGFSGGAHFTHRFLLLHPEKLSAASIVAPGSVTLIDEKRDWWIGTRDFESRFGRPIDKTAISRVALQLSVGALDLDTWEITHKQGGRHWMPDANLAGTTRPERLVALRDNLLSVGASVEHIEIPGASHNFAQIVDHSRSFFRRFVQSRLSHIIS